MPDLPSFTAVVTCNGADPMRMLDVLNGQTRAPDEILLYWSKGPAFMDFGDRWATRVTPCHDENDFGHGKRARGLSEATSDFVGFFNHDDDYHPTYVERMLSLATPDVDAVFTAWNRRPKDAFFGMYGSTAGNFIVRRTLGQEIGWVHRDYKADGRFIDAVSNAARSVAFCPDVLYWHNARRQGSPSERNSGGSS